MSGKTFSLGAKHFTIDCKGQMRRNESEDELDVLLREVAAANRAISISEHDALLIRADFLMTRLFQEDPETHKRLRHAAAPDVLEFFSGSWTQSKELSDLARSMRTEPPLLVVMYLSEGVAAANQMRGGLDPMSLDSEFRGDASNAVKEMLESLTEISRLASLNDGVFHHPFARLIVLAARLKGVSERFDRDTEEVFLKAGFSVKSAQQKPLTPRNTLVLEQIVLTRFLRRQWDFGRVRWDFSDRQPDKADKKALQQRVSADLKDLHEAAQAYLDAVGRVPIQNV